MSPVGGGVRPVPQVAWDQWLDSLTRAGGGRAGRDRELIAVGEALGRVTAVPVVARWASPCTACAAMDGIAVRAADLAGPAGAVGADQPVRLPAGSFEWIDTGDPMPDGTDTVVMREWLLPQGTAA